MKHLVVRGDDVDTVVLKQLARDSRAESIEQINPRTFRLRAAQPDAGLPALCAAAQLDWAWVPDGLTLSAVRLFVTDMDSTLIDIECIDEIADMQGLKREVSAITEASMRGELDFGESLTRRVALLQGLPESTLEEVYRDRLALNPGAERLISALRSNGTYTVLVSGGFTYFTERLKERLGFDECWANQLEIKHGKLTGRIVGAMIDAAAKATHLTRIRTNLGCEVEQTVATGDGANDLPMFRAAGLSVAYRAKPVVRAAADAVIDHGGLDTLLDFLA